MEWFRMDSDMPRHPKVCALAKALDADRVTVLGHLVCFLAGVAEHAENGSLKHVDDEAIEVWSAWHGDAGKFARALKSVGLIDAKRCDVHGWKKRHEYMIRERKRKARVRKNERCGKRDLATMPYADYLHTADWNTLRRAKLREASFRCQLCYAGGALEVHHRTYERRGHELLSDLITLCPACHGKFHGKCRSGVILDETHEVACG